MAFKSDEEMARAVGGAMAHTLVTHPHFRQVVREVLLHILVEQQEANDRTLVQSFFRCCQAADVRVYLNDAGQLRVQNQAKMSRELRMVLTTSREVIVLHLEQMAKMEAACARRQQEADEDARRRLERKESRRDTNHQPHANGAAAITEKENP